MSKSDDSNIFQGLAVLSDAGIPMLKAVQIAAKSHPEISVWPNVVKRLSEGNSLASALGETNLVSRYEQEIIGVAEFTGRTAQGLTWLADACEQRSDRTRSLKYKLFLPFFVLFIGVIVATVLHIIKAPHASIFFALVQAGIILVVAVLITKIMLNVLEEGASSIIDNAALFRHTLGYKTLYEHVIFGVLLWNIQSGIDFKAGFLRISKLVNSTTLRNQLLACSHYCEHGMAVTESVKKAGLPITTQLMHVLTIAEASGGWNDAIEHYLNQQKIMLDLKVDTLFEWLPKVYYVITVLFVGSIIL